MVTSIGYTLYGIKYRSAEGLQSLSSLSRGSRRLKASTNRVSSSARYRTSRSKSVRITSLLTPPGGNNNFRWPGDWFNEAMEEAENMILESADVTRWLGIGSGDDNWTETAEGAYVLQPPPSAGTPKSVVHFVGGAFVGAAPQLTYRRFLEAVAMRGAVVVATPFSSGLDHMRIADEVQFKLDRALQALHRQHLPEGLPVVGIGHSLGSLIQVLVGSRYAASRSANILLSFNIKPVSEAIPLFSPLMAPLTRSMGPLLQELSKSPLVRDQMSSMQQLRGSSPAVVQQLLPLVDQLQPLAADLAEGRETYTPSEADTSRMARQYYAVPRNLLVRFADDGIDATPQAALWLQEATQLSRTLDLTIRAYPGQHDRPLQQPLPDLPPDIQRAASQGSDMIGLLASLSPARQPSPLGELSRRVDSLKASTSASNAAIEADLDMLAQDICDWMHRTPASAVPPSPSTNAASLPSPAPKLSPPQSAPASPRSTQIPAAPRATGKATRSSPTSAPSQPQPQPPLRSSPPGTPRRSIPSPAPSDPPPGTGTPARPPNSRNAAQDDQPNGAG